MAEDSSDFEIGSVENFGGVKDQEFSHSSLVMTSMRRVSETAGHELRAGWINTKTDRQGNQIRTYIEDTRKAFIESVKSCMMIMACDIDEEAEEYIDGCLKDIEEKKKELIALNDYDWSKKGQAVKDSMSKVFGYHVTGKLTYPILKEELVEFETEMYRSIFAELGRLTKRLDYYKAETFEA